MEAEERPAKLRKLSHDGEDQNPPVIASLLDALPHYAVDDDVEQPQKNEAVTVANNSDANGSLEKAPPGTSSAPAEPISISTAPLPDPNLPQTPGLSKNQLKKLRKKQEWEAGRVERRLFRKEKTQAKKARKRAARDAAKEGTAPMNGEASQNGQATSNHNLIRSGVPKHVQSKLLPITLIIDCAFDKLMHDKERISLGSQITRSYSDNHRAPFKAHFVISSFGGELKTRFDTVLNEHYKNWKGVRVLEEDFVEAAEQAKEWMESENKGGSLTGAFALDAERGVSVDELKKEGEIVYLTSDSENTLDRLKPYSTYIIGGLVDKNRHKGICYKSACDRGIKTAKLPIGEYMDMQSRFVLATNHVVEIMIHWLACGDWGEAFLKVVPKRKGGRLKQIIRGLNNGEEQGERAAEDKNDGVENEIEEEAEEDGNELDEGGSGQGLEDSAIVAVPAHLPTAFLVGAATVEDV